MEPFIEKNTLVLILQIHLCVYICIYTLYLHTYMRFLAHTGSFNRTERGAIHFLLICNVLLRALKETVCSTSQIAGQLSGLFGGLDLLFLFQYLTLGAN